MHRTGLRQTYGASRLGMETYENVVLADVQVYTHPVFGTFITAFPVTVNDEFAEQRVLKMKRYELNSHQSSVHITVSDRKLSVQHGTTTHTAFYTADVASYGDYYSFGMQKPGRFGTEPDEKYRYKHQGQESDSEILGEGNSFAYEYRMSDARLGRFWSIDPLAGSFPYYSPYHFCSNNPIMAVDLEGLQSSVQVNYNETSVTINRNENNQFEISYTDWLNVPRNYQGTAHPAYAYNDLQPGGQMEAICADCPMGPTNVVVGFPKLQVTRYVDVEKEVPETIPGTPEHYEYHPSKEEWNMVYDYANYNNVRNPLESFIDNDLGVPANMEDRVLKSITIRTYNTSGHETRLKADFEAKYGAPVTIEPSSTPLTHAKSGSKEFNYQAVTYWDDVELIPGTADQEVTTTVTETKQITVDPVIINQ